MDELTSIVGEPKFKPTPVVWSKVEGELGVRLPADYKSFCDSYPALLVNGLLRICHPTCSDSQMNLLEDALLRTSLLRESVMEFPALHPYPAYPDEGGLLCWGNTSYQVQCYWLTEGNPDDWPVVIGDELGLTWRYEGGFSSFVAASLKGELDHAQYGRFTGVLKELDFFA